MYAWYCRHASTAAGNAAPPPPLVVNTHGWVKGFGFDVLVDMLRTLSITHSVHIMSPNPRRNLPQGAFWKEPPGEGMTEPASGLEPLILEVPALVFQGSGSANGGNPSPSQPPATELEGATPPAPQRTGPVAVEQRALQWMAFANACCTAAADGSSACHPTEADVGDRLAAAPPLEVSLDAITVRVLYTAVPPAEAARVLNGAVVGLCKGIAPATSSKLGVCLGLGIVRAVDVTARKAYVLTPLSPAELEHVEVFEVGRLELPPALLQTKKFLSPYVALHSLAASGTGAGVIKSRNNLLRARQQGG